MQFPGDRMEADHQPHWKLLEHVQDADVRWRRDRGLPVRRARSLRKGGLYGRAYTIVLGKPRHKLGRTHGGKSHDAFTEAMVEVDKYQAKTDDETQRKAVIAGLTWSMKKDAAAMRVVIKRPETDEAWEDIKLGGTARTDLVKAVRAQILEGLERVEGQPIREYGAS